ncbi:MAG: NUDIX domain-containing protein [bacterium]
MKKEEQGLRYAILANDIVIFAIRDGTLNVLLVKVKSASFRGLWAVPGGLVKPSETVDTCARRYLWQVVTSGDVFLEQLYTFGKVDRDPQGRVVSVTYYALIPDAERILDCSDDYAAVAWFPVDRLPELAYDHDEVVQLAVDRLRSKTTYSNIIFSLLAREFTLSDLQRAYEIVLNRNLDKRNFRKKILSLNQLVKTGRKTTGKAHRPADLYRFRLRRYATIQIL